MRVSRSAIRWYIAATVVLSISAFAVLAQVDVAQRGSPLEVAAGSFAWPGTTIWWLTLGGPFQTFPESHAGQAFAALANTASWLLLGWVVRVTVRAVASRFKAP